uniref:OmpR/PhoB-type domain-containing protein n=1 Tax=Thermosporothrix sp. COM3 TaxID=2490863 RepID=A0A455SJG6_9CHLR|nr:hypothetical protein KTC_22490 [Thermosporothrix sp. COM3]
MSGAFLHFTAQETLALPAGHILMLNTEERIVTLFHAEYVRAQCRLTYSAMRLLFLLLLAPNGADYAELLACLHSKERGLFTATSLTELRERLAPQIHHWSSWLKEAEPEAVEQALKKVRRVIKERNGLNTLLEKHHFGMTIRVLYGKGYLLTGAD